MSKEADAVWIMIKEAMSGTSADTAIARGLAALSSPTTIHSAADFEQKCYKLASIAPIAYDDLRALIAKTATRTVGGWQSVYDDFYHRARQGDFSWIEETTE